MFITILQEQHLIHFLGKIVLLLSFSKNWHFFLHILHSHYLCFHLLYKCLILVQTYLCPILTVGLWCYVIHIHMKFSFWLWNICNSTILMPFCGSIFFLICVVNYCRISSLIYVSGHFLYYLDYPILVYWLCNIVFCISAFVFVRLLASLAFILTLLNTLLSL